MKNKSIALQFLLLVFSVVSFASVPSVVARAFGGNGDDAGKDIIATRDGGIVVVGYTSSSEGEFFSRNGEEDFLIAKFSEDLKLQWWNSFGGSRRDMAEGVVQTANGNFVLVGLTESSDGDVSFNNGFGDYWVICVSAEGELLWERSFGGRVQDHAFDLVDLGNGSLVVGGYTRSNDGDVENYIWGEDFWLVEIDEDGTLLSQWLFDVAQSEDSPRRLFQDGEGSIYSVGYFSKRDCNVSCQYVDNQLSLLKLDPSGEMIWFKQYGDRWLESGYDGTVSSEGQIFVVGEQDAGQSLFSSGYGGRDFWVLASDENGEEILSRNFGGSYSETARGIIELDTGDLMIAGHTNSSNYDVKSNHGKTDGWVIVIDVSGKLLESTTIGGAKDDLILSLAKADGYVFFTGHTNSSEFGVKPAQADRDLWLISMKR